MSHQEEMLEISGFSKNLEIWNTSIYLENGPNCSWSIFSFPRLREISDIAKRQVEILNAQQQSREKEVESVRMQLLDYQVSTVLALVSGFFPFS